MTMTNTFTGERTLRYATPAARWEAALPLGNGRLGAMVWGGVEEATFDLNEETLWSGALQRDWNNPAVPALLPEIRAAVAAGDYRKANDLCYKVQGIFNESYMPLGRLTIAHDLPGAADGDRYERRLDIVDAVHTTTFTRGPIMVTRESFVSAPDDALVVHVRSNVPIASRITLGSQLRHEVRADEAGTVCMEGQSPSHVIKCGLETPNGAVLYDPKCPGLRFYAEARIQCEDGTIEVSGETIVLSGCTGFTLTFCAATNFAGHDVAPVESRVEPVARVYDALTRACAKSYEAVQEAHRQYFSALMSRVDLALPAVPETCLLPTDQRLAHYETNEDPALAALFFQYGRYLLISSSLPGCLPATLQGIWNDQLRPAWMSNWTLDLNIQMTYWASWTTNLPECEEPLLRFVENLQANGRETARVNYAARGWVCHNTVDLWLQTGPGGIEEPRWCLLPLGGVWACQHLWMHYRFHGDQAYRPERAYAVMKGAAEFCLDWLIEDKDGTYVTCPSVSPENWFKVDDGEKLAISKASTYDMQLIRDLFENCIEAATLLGVDASFVATLRERVARLHPAKVGQYGQLQEWAEDWDSPRDQHRHIAHLYALFPGDAITPAKAPALWDAARESLLMRLGERAETYAAGKGDGDTGWSLAWKIAWWARLHDAVRVRRSLAAMLTPCDPRRDHPGGHGGLYPNLLNASPPFTMEGNLGATAGIAEALMQSHDGTIHVLPAVPDNWLEGRVRGLKARGGLLVDIDWRAAGEIRVRCHGKAGRAVSVTCRDETRRCVCSGEHDGAELVFLKEE